MSVLELAFECGESSLSVRHFRIDEAISKLFTVKVVARSPAADIDLEKIVGRPASLRAKPQVATASARGLSTARRSRRARDERGRDPAARELLRARDHGGADGDHRRRRGPRQAPRRCARDRRTAARSPMAARLPRARVSEGRLPAHPRLTTTDRYDRGSSGIVPACVGR